MTASVGAQLFAALVAAGFGGAAAPLTFLYSVKKLPPLHRFAADLFATVAVTLLFLLSAETGSNGRPSLYCAVAFLISLLIVRDILSRLAALASEKLAKKLEREDSLLSRLSKAAKRFTAPPSPSQDDGPIPSSSRCNPRRAGKRSVVCRREKGGKAVPRRRADGWD